MRTRRRPETKTQAAASPLRATGVLRVTPAGFGLVEIDERDVFLGPGALRDALDGDHVEVELTGRSEKGDKGRVARVLSRPARRLSGVVAGDRFLADDPRFARALRLEDSWAPLLAPSDVVGVELLSTVEPNLPEVRVVRAFGARGVPRVEENALLWREDLSEGFSDDVTDEAQRAAVSALSVASTERVDLRHVPLITVDPASAEDHDDALYARREEDGGVRAFVAIADVGAFVPEGGVLDAEARRRGSSLYFPTRVVPMLPPVLSSHAASLLPGVDRAAMVLEIGFDASLAVASSRLIPALIRSRGKLTYDDAAEVLRTEGAGGSPEARAHAEPLRVLDELARFLRERRQERGAIAVESPEVRIAVDPASGLPIEIANAETSPSLSRAHELVEELMLLANETVAAMLKERGADALFRVHAAPSDERAHAVIEAARQRGVILDPALGLDAAALRDAIMALPDVQVRDELASLLLDAMPAALYAARRYDHFALASRHYVHFTSPIRRYADLTIHRAIRATLLGAPEAAAIDPEQVNATQQRTRSIQREIGNLYAALLMAPRMGHEGEGTVLRVLKQQVLVGLDAPSVVVRCERRGPTELAPGARARVRITGVSIAQRTVTGELVPSPPPS